MSPSAPVAPSRPHRLWVLALVAAGVGAGLWLSSGRRAGPPRAAVVLGDGRPKLLEFGMGLCDQCKRMKPVMAQARTELGARLEVEEVDIRNEENAALGEHLGLRVIPTVMLLDRDGKTTWRHEGFIPYAELAAAVGERLPSVPPPEETRRER